jgi:flagellar L-ring protein precursor FlgH
MQRRLVLFVLILVLAGAGCASKQADRAMEQPTAPQQDERVATQDSCSATQGSLWSGGSQGLAQDTIAGDVGDIVTVAIYEEASASKEAETATERSSSVSAGVSNFFGLQSDLLNINKNLRPEQLVQAESANDFQGTGETMREETLTATITTQIVDVQPNGNFLIRGSKRVQVNHEEQIIHLSGKIRPEDIDANNMVNSKFILDANIDYTGQGVLSDKQKPGWLVRIMDHVWPF